MAKAKAVCPDSTIASTLYHCLNRVGHRATMVGRHVITEMDREELVQWFHHWEWDLKKLRIEIRDE